jgi:hypothetical protein
MMSKLHSLTLRRYAKLLGGEIYGDSVLCPGPGRGPDDRSLLVTPPGLTLSWETAEAANARDRASALASGKIRVRP